MEYSYKNSNEERQYRVARDEFHRHMRFHAHYKCSSCREFHIYDDLNSIVMEDEDGDWEKDVILCDDCWEKQKEEQQQKKALEKQKEEEDEEEEEEEDDEMSYDTSVCMLKHMLKARHMKLDRIDVYHNAKVGHFINNEGGKVELELNDEDAEWFEKVAKFNHKVACFKTLCEKMSLKKMKEYIMTMFELYSEYSSLKTSVESGEKIAETDGAYLMACNCCQKFYEVFGELEPMIELLEGFLFTIGEIEGKTAEEVDKMRSVYIEVVNAKMKNGYSKDRGTIMNICFATKKLSEIFVWKSGDWFLKKDEGLGEVKMPFEIIVDGKKFE